MAKKMYQLVPKVLKHGFCPVSLTSTCTGHDEVYCGEKPVSRPKPKLASLASSLSRRSGKVPVVPERAYCTNCLHFMPWILETGISNPDMLCEECHHVIATFNTQQIEA